MSHSFAVLKAFALKNKQGREVHWLYMIRDPFGPEAITNPKTKWNTTDTKSWTPEFIK